MQLGYAGTIHGVQGETAHTGHLVLDEHTSAGAAYVGMTRGRTANTVHIITGDVADPLTAARGQWIDAAGRGRTDLGLEHARIAAEQAAADYAVPSPVPAAGEQRRLGGVLDELRRAWSEQARANEQLQRLEPRLAHARADATRREDNERILTPLRQQMHDTRAAADAADKQAAIARALLNQRAETTQAALRAKWGAERPAAAAAARAVHAGTGRFGRGRAAVADAQGLLDDWAEKWRPVLPELTDVRAAARYAARHPAGDRIEAAIHDYAGRETAKQMPQHVQVIHAAEQARQDARDAGSAYINASEPLQRRQTILHAASGHRDLAEDLPRLTDQTTTARARAQRATQRVGQLLGDPAITSRPDAETILAGAHSSWQLADTHVQAQARERAQRANADHAEEAARQRMHDATGHSPGYGPDTGRSGPSLGR